MSQPVIRALALAGPLAAALLLAAAAGCESPPEAVSPSTRTVAPPPARAAAPSAPAAPAEAQEPASRREVFAPGVAESDLTYSPARATYEDALRERERGVTERAVELLRRAVEIDPEHYLAWGALFDLLKDGDDAAAAADACAGLVASQPQNGHGAAARNLECAVWHMRADRLEQAEEYARESVRQSDGQLQPLVTLSAILLQRGDSQGAFDLLDGQIGSFLGPTEVSALNNMGSALLRLDRVDEAIATFQRAAEADPTRFEVLIGLHDALRAAGREDEAQAALAQARALDPENPAVVSRAPSP